MARLIPPVITGRCKSPGERMLLQRFHNDPLSEDWIVIHSLGTARHPTRIEGEVDLLVLAPGFGVLCVEVKAGSVRRLAGTWYYGAGVGRTSSRGPFKQAAEAMHAVRRYVRARAPDLSEILYVSAVFFTDIDFREESPEWHPWQHAGRSDLFRHPVSAVCGEILEQAHRHFLGKVGGGWYDAARSRPGVEQVNRLTSLLRSDFEYLESPRSRIDQSEATMLRVTEEQAAALDALEVNERVLFTGPAGTGKTCLAIEAARRSVQRGERVLLACFNQLLARSFSEVASTWTETATPSARTGTLHGIMLSLSGKARPPTGDAASFWEQELPGSVCESILSDRIEAPMFDRAVVDEIQDLLTDPYLDVLDLLLTGGMAGGSWAFFGDLERQAIYQHDSGSTTQQVLARLRGRSPASFVHPLRINCRNSPEIAMGVELLAGLDPGYTRVLGESAGQEIRLRFFKSEEDQQRLLLESLRSLTATFEAPEIVVLSTRRDTLSCAGRAARGASLPVHLQPFATLSGPEAIAYGSIHAFKGLEAPAVILTDVESLEGELANALLYIGMSRARQHLTVLLAERTRSLCARLIQRNLLPAAQE